MPVTQSPLDLYSQCEFLSPGILGHKSWYSFRNRYAVMVPMKMGPRSFQKVIGYQRLDELKHNLAEFSFRVTKEEALPDLPPKLYTQREVGLTGLQKSAYEDMRKHSVAILSGEEREGLQATAFIVLTQILRLHQIVCGFITTDTGNTIALPSHRIDSLMEVIEETQGKVIIWANYSFNIEEIVRALASAYGKDTVESYYGQTNSTDRARAIHRFKKDPLCRYLVGNPRTGGMGLSLEAATTVIYFSNGWSLEDRMQSEDRAHRAGQMNQVTYVDLVSPGTVDEKILRVLREKKNISDEMVNWRKWVNDVSLRH